MKTMNKKGAEMTIGTIIIIILALVVLVVLIFGFTTGWQNLWQRIIGLGGGEINVQSVVQSCQLACAGQQQYDYCTRTRDVFFGEGDDRNGKYNCKGLENKALGTGLDCLIYPESACPPISPAPATPA